MLLITATSVDEHRQSNGKIEKETHSKNGKREKKIRNHMNNALYITSNLYNYESELESSTAQHRLFFR